jgi:glycosyltransferase involved in cell wall biosynthesis
MKKRLLLLNYEFPPLGGGASPVSFELAKFLVKHYEYEIDVVTMGYKNLPKKEVVIPGLTIYRVPCWRSKKETCQPFEQLTYLLSGYLHCRKLLKIKKYDLMHVHFLIPTGILALILKKQFQLPYIVTSHGSDVPGFNPDRFTFLHRFTQPLLLSICKNAASVVSPSNYLKKLMLQKISPELKEKITYIPNGIDTTQFVPGKKEPYIFSSGRLLPRKGFQDLIAAVSNASLPYEVHIAGDGPWRAHLEQMARDSKTKIIFHGWLSNTSSEYKSLLEHASIYCLLSKNENASIALLEAMSAGCAVITKNDTGTAETIGDSGLLIERDDTKELEKILESLTTLPDMQRTLGKKAHHRVQEHFSLDKITQQYHHLMNQYI